MVQTRRLVRRLDENAPPATSTIATRSRSANTTAAANNGNSTAIPVMKRTASTAAASTRSSTVTVDAKPALGKTMTRRRAALGEIPQGSENGPKKKADAGKGKLTERRPLASTQQSQQATRRTTRATAAEPKDDKTTVSKRKLQPTTRTARPGASRGNSATSTSTTTSDRGVRTSRVPQPTSSMTEAGPAAKRLRPSPSPTPPREVADDDVLHATNYDADVPELQVERIQRSPRIAKDAGWYDLDAEDEGDPTMVSEYVIDAFNYMMEVEVSLILRGRGAC